MLLHEKAVSRPWNEKRTSGKVCPAWYHAETLPEGATSVRLAEGPLPVLGKGCVGLAESAAGFAPALLQNAACAVNLGEGFAVRAMLDVFEVSSIAASLNIPSVYAIAVPQRVSSGISECSSRVEICPRCASPRLLLYVRSSCVPSRSVSLRNSNSNSWRCTERAPAESNRSFAA